MIKLDSMIDDMIYLSFRDIDILKEIGINIDVST